MPKILTGEPIITCIAEQRLNTDREFQPMIDWVKSRRPECVAHLTGRVGVKDLFPRENPFEVSSNELLVELAGRKCYDSFSAKAGRKDNREYIEHTQEGDIPHASIMYHAKMTFFIAGVSRRVSLEMIRNYVGADRDQEGSPSQESTRFTHHYGYYVCPPAMLDADLYPAFVLAVEDAHARYESYINRAMTMHKEVPKGLARKRIYEAASGLLLQQAETSFIWTTNPVAIAKFIREREHEAADLEIQRFARCWRLYCTARWPNLFPQPWMRSTSRE